MPSPGSRWVIARLNWEIKSECCHSLYQTCSSSCLTAVASLGPKEPIFYSSSENFHVMEFLPVCPPCALSKQTFWKTTWRQPEWSRAPQTSQSQLWGGGDSQSTSCCHRPGKSQVSLTWHLSKLFPWQVWPTMRHISTQDLTPKYVFNFTFYFSHKSPNTPNKM